MSLPFLQYFSKYYDSYKTYKMGTREMQLREHNALGGGPEFESSTYVIQFRTANESSSRRSHTLLWTPWAPALKCAETHMQTYTYTHT